MILSSAQQGFVDLIAGETARKVVLVAAAGSGASAAVAYAGRQLIDSGQIDSILVLGEYAVSQHVWMEQAARLDLKPSALINDQSAKFVATTYAGLDMVERQGDWLGFASARRWMIVCEEINHRFPPAQALVKDLLGANVLNRAVELRRTPLPRGEEGLPSEEQPQYLMGDAILADVFNPQGLKEHSPSLGIVEQLHKGLITLDSLNWREFEKLIAKLLEAQGYEVTLMKGTKDGGVDILAHLDRGPGGRFRAVWQAKKYSQHRKIDISVVRELADVRGEWGANKAVIVTTSYLTRDALNRVKRENLFLDKVDRDDVNAWIHLVQAGREH